MPVSITWSEVSSGPAITSVDHGTVGNGAYTSPNLQVYINHDGANPITDCKFFFQQKATGYAGDASASLDFSEIKAWGDDSTVAGHGGVQVNMDPSNNSGYNATTWDLSESTKQTGEAFTMYTGVGDTSAAGVTLDAEMAVGMTTDGEIPAGVETSFLCRFQIPTDEDTVGIRQIDQTLKYVFTS